MTNIVKKKSAAVAEQQDSLLDRNKPENEDIAQQIMDLKLFVANDKVEGSYMVPRFGLLSLKMRNTPMYAYDHPALMKICNTAFTDGIHVFISADFLRTLNAEEDKSKGMEQGAVPLVLHELMHMLKNHVRRLSQFPKDIANQAEDLSINAQLQLGFPEISWVPSLREVGLSFREGDVERYAKLAEETIARELIDKQKKDPNGQGQGQGKGQGGGGKGKGKGSPSKGGGGSPQSGKGDPSDGSGDQEQDGQGEDDEWGDNHTITPEELIETLEQNGLGHVLDALEMPHSADDVERISEIEEAVRIKDVDAIRQAANQKSQMGGKYPGAHIVDSCAEMVKGFTEGKLSWRLGLKNFAFGDGMRFRYTESEPGDIYYIDPKDMGLNNEIYVGAEVPHKPEEIVLCLIDTSGSVDKKQLTAFCSEIFNLKRENAGVGDTASEIVVISADTVVRGEPIEITEENMDQLFDSGIGLSGRGGTDLGSDLRQTMKLPLFEDKKISAVCFFTDLCDTPPKKSDFPSNLPLCFITMPHTMSEEFARAVKDFARVYPIEEGIEVDLTESHLETAVNTRSAKR